MKKITYYLAIAFFVLSFTACNKDSDGLEAEEAQAILNNAVNQLDDDLDAVINSEGVDALVGLNELGDMFGDETKAASSRELFSFVKLDFKTGTLSPQLKSTMEDGSFGFAENVGTYSWNVQTQAWDVSPRKPDNAIVINYPSEGAAGVVNNATITVSNVEEQIFTDEYDSYYVPTRIVANLYVDAVRQVELDFTASYDTEGMLVSSSATLYTNPFTANYSISDNGISMTGNAALTRDGTTIMSVGGTVVFTTADKDDLASVDGFVQYAALKVKLVADSKAFEEMDDDLSLQQINDNVTADLYSYPEEEKIGYLELFYTADEEIDVQIVYNDESTEPASVYYNQIIETLDNFFEANELAKK